MEDAAKSLSEIVEEGESNLSSNLIKFVLMAFRDE